MTEERVQFALHAQIEKQALAITDVDGFVQVLLPDYLRLPILRCPPQFANLQSNPDDATLQLS
jgi:hypothetical protein